MGTIDLVIPVYNEGLALQDFHRSLTDALAGLDYGFRIIYVNDGSTDDTSGVLCHLRESDPRVVVVELSRNFGHQAAIGAGLDFFDADALIMMDGDGEHPALLIPEMVRLYQQGYDVIHTQRSDLQRKGIFFKRLSGNAFYWLISRLGETTIVEGAADFRLLSRAAVEALRRLPEYHRFYRGMVQWIGFRSVILPYVPAPRIAGKSKYSLRKMLRLAGDGMFSFSLAPLRLALIIGASFLFLAIAEVGYVLHFWIRGDTSSLVPGWSSLMIVLTVSSGISMLLVGILGVYIGMIFQEVKRRPVYIVRSDKGQRTAIASQNHAEAVSVRSVEKP